jgi:phosphatidate cytidylyltransferase
VKNIIIRTLTGIIYITIILGGLFVHPNIFLCVFGILLSLTLWEFYTITGIKKWRRVIAVGGGVYLFGASFFYASDCADGRVFLPCMFYIMFVLISELYNKKNVDHIRSCAYIILGQVYCAIPFALLNFLVFLPGKGYTPWLVLALFAFVWINDTGAFLVGRTIGKHRLFERISPKKSWEGFAGGMLLTMGASLIPAHIHIYNSMINAQTWLCISVLIVVFATWGDLVESLLKRTIGVKDTGALLPGHGGMLDRLDSILMTIPALYIFIRLMIIQS